MPFGTTKVLIPWPNSAASIPDHLERVTAYDERFLQGGSSSYSAPVNGGGSHTHVDAGHTHTGNPHTHAFSAGSSNSGNVSDIHSVLGMSGNASEKNHAHNTATSDAATITYSSDAMTVTAETVRPPYVKCIILRPTSDGADLPPGALGLTDQTNIPDGCELCPIGYDERFVQGANTDGDGGGTVGDPTSPTDTEHSHQTVSHDHLPTDHSHAATQCGVSSAPKPATNATGRGVWAHESKHHDISLDAETLGRDNVSDESPTTSAASNEPRHIVLLGLTKSAGRSATPVGLVLPFDGNASTDIPDDWELLACDDESQVKITRSAGSISITAAGTNTHSHTTVHSHTHGDHHHKGIEIDRATIYRQGGATGVQGAEFLVHNHAWTADSSTPTMQNATASVGAGDVRSPYRRVVWIKRVAMAGKRVTCGSIHHTDDVVMAA